eukprot:1998633-Alexandrium_andersonii.AAC.1
MALPRWSLHVAGLAAPRASCCCPRSSRRLGTTSTSSVRQGPVPSAQYEAFPEKPLLSGRPIGHWSTGALCWATGLYVAAGPSSDDADGR